MKKGISPIVAVVLLIAIAVIAAVGLYFWVGGLATQQPTSTTPIVISAKESTAVPTQTRLMWKWYKSAVTGGGKSIQSPERLGAEGKRTGREHVLG